MYVYDSTTIPPMLLPASYSGNFPNHPHSPSPPLKNWFACCFKWTAPQENSNSFAVLPFMNGVTQPPTRIFRRHDIQVVSKPLKTLQQEFPSPKFRPSIEHQPNVVYKIPCVDCDWCRRNRSVS